MISKIKKYLEGEITKIKRFKKPMDDKDCFHGYGISITGDEAEEILYYLDELEKRKLPKIDVVGGENGEKFLEMTKADFEKYFAVGVLKQYNSSAGDNSVVRIKIKGFTEDMNNFVVRKGEENGY